MSRLSGKVALITAGGRGIGRGIANTFAREGASVLVTDANPDFAQEVADEIVAAGGKARASRCDVTDKADLERIVAEVVQHFGGLDILIHNAGYFPPFAIDELPDEELEKTWSINVRALFRITKLALPDLKNSAAGRLLVTSSVAGNRIGLANRAHYAASKAAVNGFIRSAAIEFGPHGITVNGVEPGLVRTERWAVSEADARKIESTIPVRRVGQPKDIAETMLFLASDAASWISGQTIVVDGGSSIMHASNFLHTMTLTD